MIDAATLLEAVARAAPRLHHPDVLRTLVTRALPERETELREIAFKAKFLVKLSTVLRRGDPLDETARARLQETWRAEWTAAHALLTALAATLPAADRDACQARFLAPSPSALAAMDELLHDLQWVQNVLLDSRA